MKTALSWTICFLSKLFNINGLHVCRFEPSCSIYARQALRQFSLFSALRLIVGRVSRCHPFAVWGFDPLPHHPIASPRKNS